MPADQSLQVEGSTTQGPFGTDTTPKPPLPDPYTNALSVIGQADSPQCEAIKKRFRDRWKIGTYRRWTFECRWLLNVLWDLGAQWTRIDGRSQKIVNMRLPTGFPRAVTNKFAKVNNDLANSIAGDDVPFNYMPRTDDPKDIGIADIGESLHEVITEETRYRERKSLLGFWFTRTGNGFIYPYYDDGPDNGSIPVPVYNCSACAANGVPTQVIDATKPCPKCGTPPQVTPPPQPTPPQIPGQPPAPPPPPPQPVQNFAPASNPDGSPATKDIHIGRLCFDVGSPFEHYQDNTIPTGSGAQRWFMRFKRYDIDAAKRDWPDFAEKIVEGMPELFPLSRNYLLAIAYAGSISSDYGYGDSVSKESMRRQINVWHLNELPSPDFPEGLSAKMLGEYVIEATPLKTRWTAGAKKGQCWLPAVQFSMSDVGSAWGKPAADYLVPLQFRRNIIESNLQLTAQRTGAPKLLTPEGCKVKNVVGEAGQLLSYNPLSLAGGSAIGKPEYLEAALGNVPPLLELLKDIDAQMEQIAGTFFLTGGDAPAGVTAASALSYLGEKAFQAISPVKKRWANKWAECFQYALELARTNWIDERILAAVGENRQWEFQKFKAADLSGAIEIRVDYNGLFPKSQATERATILQLYQMAVLAPGDPDTDFHVLEAFGETRLKGAANRAFNQAQREWDAFLNDNKIPQLKPIVQNSVFHLIQHKKDAESQEYELLPPEKQSLWDAHIQATMMDVMMQQQMMAPPQLPPGGTGPNGNTQPGSQKGSQNGSAGGNQNPPAPVRKGVQAADADSAMPNIKRPIQSP